jgi:hypothetical protein
MTLPAWPATVPTTARDGWQMPEMYRPTLATDMEGGNQRLRQQPGGNVATINYPLKPLTEAEFADFVTFVRTTLNNGASRFTMSLLSDSSTPGTKTVQFDGGKSPQVSRGGGFVHVVLSLRVYM